MHKISRDDLDVLVWPQVANLARTVLGGSRNESGSQPAPGSGRKITVVCSDHHDLCGLEPQGCDDL